MGQLNIIGDSKGSTDRVWGSCEEGGKVQDTLDAHKFHALTAVIEKVPILNWQEYLQISGGSSVVDDSTGQVMKRQDREVVEAHPSIIEIPLEITDNPLSGRVRVQLGTAGIDEGLGDLIGVSPFPNLHRRPDLWVQLGG